MSFDSHEIALIYGLETSGGKGINQLKTLVKNLRASEVEADYIRSFWHEMNSLFQILRWKNSRRKHHGI